MNKLFIGHTRFSVHQYNSGSFKATRQGENSRFTEDEYTRWLYDDERLEPRTEIFTQESLPQLAASAEACDLVHVVHYSSSLPQKYQDILRHSARQYPFLHLNEAPGIVAPSSPSKKVLNRVLKERLPDDGVFGIYRLDDDDVLPINFFERMDPYVVEEHVGWRVSFPESLTAIRTRGEYIFPWSRYFPKAAAGLLSIHQKTPDGVFHGLQTRVPAKGHMKLDTVYPTILDSREPGFFQARHQSQDSILGTGSAPFFSSLISTAINAKPVPPHLFEEYFPFVSANIRRQIRDCSQRIDNQTGVTLNDHNGALYSVNLDNSNFLMAEMEPTAPGTPEIKVKIQVSRDASTTTSKLSDYVESTGMLEIDEDLFVGSLTFHKETTYGSIVLEMPPGCSITQIHLSSNESITLESLSVYKLS